MSTLPPPPPPPPLPSTNAQSFNQHDSTVNGKSQLLLAIEKGVKLKNVPSSSTNVNGHNLTLPGTNGILHNDEDADSVKATKNLLHAELSSKLQRRKENISSNTKSQNTEENHIKDLNEICSIIDHKNPNFITPKNSTITAIRKQTSELKAAQANTANPTATNKQLPDANRIANLVDLVALLPDNQNLMEEINRIQEQAVCNKDKQPAEKRMISHGKPNFIIKPINPTIKSKFENHVQNENQSNITEKLKPIETLPPPIPPTRTDESYQSVIDLQKKFNTTQNIETSTPNTVVPATINPSPTPFRKFDTIPRHKSKTPPSGFKATNNGFVQSKLKVLENNETMQTTPKFSPRFSPSPFRKFENLHVQTTTNGSSTSVNNLAQFQSSPVSPRRAQLFKQQKNILSSQITSPTINHIENINENSNISTNNNDTFSTVTNSSNTVVVSFSKDLSNAPNRYPDKIKVTKSLEMTTSNNSESKQQSKFLSDIKFIIDSNGAVETVVQK